MSKDDWKNLNGMNVSHIRQWLDAHVFHHVSNKRQLHELLTKLEVLHDRKLDY